MKNLRLQETFPGAAIGLCHYQLARHTTPDFRVAVASYEGNRLALLGEIDRARITTAHAPADEPGANLARTLSRNRQAAAIN